MYLRAFRKFITFATGQSANSQDRGSVSVLRRGRVRQRHRQLRRRAVGLLRPRFRRELRSGVNVIKLFTAAIYGFSEYARVFVSGKPFQPGLMLMGEAKKGLPGTNTLAYYENP